MNEFCCLEFEIAIREKAIQFDRLTGRTQIVGSDGAVVISEISHCFNCGCEIDDMSAQVEGDGE